MKILVVGSGAREHILCDTFVKLGHQVLAAPGRESLWQGVSSVAVQATDIPGVTNWAKANRPDLVVVGPENPLVDGLADRLRQEKIPVFGPSARAAFLSEGSKAESKSLMRAAKVPTSAFRVYSDYDAAKACIMSNPVPIVVKASGLAAGKGAYVCKTREEALEALDQAMVKKVYGKAGDQVVIEQFVAGPEVSAMAICDGETCLMLPSSRDHKQAFDGNQGKMTGGMGAVSPAPGVTPEMMEQAKDRIILPFLAELKKAGAPFVGCLYGGLKISPSGLLMTLEFNCRFGDPEILAVLRRLAPSVDLAQLLLQCANGRLDPIWETRQNGLWIPECAIDVVLATKGYPDQDKADYGKVISGIGEAHRIPGVAVFDAGSKLAENTTRVNTSGRVLNVTAIGPTLEKARETVYRAVGCINFQGMQFRTDIGLW